MDRRDHRDVDEAPEEGQYNQPEGDEREEGGGRAEEGVTYNITEAQLRGCVSCGKQLTSCDEALGSCQDAWDNLPDYVEVEVEPEVPALFWVGLGGTAVGATVLGFLLGWYLKR